MLIIVKHGKTFFFFVHARRTGEFRIVIRIHDGEEEEADGVVHDRDGLQAHNAKLPVRHAAPR